MKNVTLFLFVVFMTNIAVAMDIENNIMDMRKAWLEFPHNKQDENGNTFWHNLARESEHFQNWSQVHEKMEQFKKDNKNWLPNILLINKNGKTARQEAKASYNRSGNAVAGLLAFVFLKQQEDNFLNKMAVKDSRDMMSYAQHYEHPNK